MFAKFDEIPAMTLQDIKETKLYGRTTLKQYTLHKKSLHGGGGVKNCHKECVLGVRGERRVTICK